MGGDRFDREASRKSTSSSATTSSSSTSSSSTSSSSSSLSIASPKSHSPDPEKLATTDHTFDSSASPTSFGRGKSRATTDFGESLVFQEADDDEEGDDGDDDDATDGSPLGPPPSAPAPAAPSSPHRRFHSRTNASLPAGRSMGAGMKSTATMGESLIFEEVSSPTADDGGDSVSRSHSRSQPSTAHLKKSSGFSYTHNESLMFEEVPGEDDGEDEGDRDGGRRREEEEDDDDDNEARMRRSPHPEEDADEGAPHAKHTSPSPEKHARYMPPAVAADTPATQPQQEEEDAGHDEEALPPAAADVDDDAGNATNSNSNHTNAAKAGTDSSNNNDNDDDEERRRRRQRRQEQQPEGLAPPPSDHARSSTGTHRTDGRRSTAVRGPGGSAASEAESGRAEAPAGSAWPANLRHEAGPARTERHRRKEGGWAMVNQPGLEKEGKKHRDAGYVGTVFGAPPSPVAVAPPVHANRERGAFRQLRDIDKDRSEVICGKCKTKGHPTKNCPLVGRERFFDASGGVEHRRNIQGTFKDQQYTARMQARIQRSRPDLSGVRSKFRDWKQPPPPRSGTPPPHSDAGASGRASTRAQQQHHHPQPLQQAQPPRARAGSRTSSPSHPAGGSNSSRGPSPADTARSRGRTASVSPADRARKEFVIHKLHEENRMLQEAIENMRHKMHVGGGSGGGGGGGRQADPSPEATVPMAGGLPPTHRAGTRSGGSVGGGGGGVLRSASGSSGYAPRDAVPPEPQPHPSTASHQQYKQQQHQMMLEQQHQREQQQYNVGPSPRGGGRSVSQPRSNLPPQSGWVDVPMQKQAPTRVRTAAPSFVDWQVRPSPPTHSTHAHTDTHTGRQQSRPPCEPQCFTRACPQLLRAAATLA